MNRCERCHEFLIFTDVCGCVKFEIEDEDGEMHEFYATHEEAAALKYAEWTNVHGDYHLMDSEETIKVSGHGVNRVEYVVSAEPDIHYSAHKNV